MTLRVCIYGAGAIGGFLAARLANAGVEISCVARGAHLQAMQTSGLRLLEAQRELRVDVPCSDAPAALGTQDIVILTVKTHAVAGSLAGISTLLGADTTVVTAQNGLPWWYGYQDTSALVVNHLDSVDPGGRIWTAIGPERAIGAIIYPAAELLAPGVVRHVYGNRLSLGEPNGTATQRLTEICQLLEQAGLETTPTPDIRQEIWQKLAISAAINPLSLLRRCVIAKILASGRDRALLTTLIREAQAVARSLGVAPAQPAEALVDALEVVGPHKTSMLTDIEAGRTLELDALTGAVVEVGTLMQVPTPELQHLYDQVRQMVQK